MSPLQWYSSWTRLNLSLTCGEILTWIQSWGNNHRNPNWAVPYPQLACLLQIANVKKDILPSSPGEGLGNTSRRKETRKRGLPGQFGGFYCRFYIHLPYTTVCVKFAERDDYVKFMQVNVLVLIQGWRFVVSAKLVHWESKGKCSQEAESAQAGAHQPSLEALPPPFPPRARCSVE